MSAEKWFTTVSIDPKINILIYHDYKYTKQTIT